MNHEKAERTMSDFALIRRVAKYGKPVRLSLFVGIILSSLAALIELLPPIINGEISRVLLNQTRYYLIAVYIALSVAILIASSIINYASTMILQKAGQRIVYDVRNEVFSHLENLSIAQLNEHPVGRLVTRVTNDTNSLSELFTNVFVNLIRYAITIIAVLVILFRINVKLTLILLAITPLVILAMIAFRYFSRRAYREVRTNLSNMNSFLSEHLSGMKITQIFNQEEKVYQNFKEKNKKLEKSNLKEIYTISVFRPIVYFLFVITRAVIILFGSQDVINANIIWFGIPELIKFYDSIDRFYNPIEQLIDQFNVIQSSFSACEKIFGILDIKRDILDSDEAIEVDGFQGEIEFRNVWFAYHPGEWVLKDFSCHIKPGETVAFVGATGAGKTTILALIVRNYEIQEGQILIDGRDIKDYKIESLRKNIGQMLQDVFLFSGTILSNIQMHDEAITKEAVVEAARYVGADTFIDKLEGTYDFMVQERGNNFSSGQRQLLSFARTIVHRPSVMILDEATANIDTETEILIQNSLEKMMNVGTMLIVAHRLSTVQHADKIIVLHRGEKIEEGTHQALLKQKGRYYHLYELQYRNGN